MMHIYRSDRDETRISNSFFYSFKFTHEFVHLSDEAV